MAWGPKFFYFIFFFLLFFLFFGWWWWYILCINTSLTSSNDELLYVRLSINTYDKEKEVKMGVLWTSDLFGFFLWVQINKHSNISHTVNYWVSSLLEYITIIICHNKTTWLIKFSVIILTVVSGNMEYYKCGSLNFLLCCWLEHVFRMFLV